MLSTLEASLHVIWELWQVWSDCLYSSKDHLRFLILFFLLNIEFQSGFDRRCQPYVTQCLGHCFCSMPLALSWYLWPFNQHEGCFKNNHVSFSSLLHSRTLKYDGRPVLLPAFVTALFISSWESEGWVAKFWFCYCCQFMPFSDSFHLPQVYKA